LKNNMLNMLNMVNTPRHATIASPARQARGLALGSRSMRWSIGVGVILASATCAATYAMQAADPTIPPQPDKGLNLYSPVGGYALMAIAAAAVIAVNLMPAKRGHQD
jgi:hypothetical protein